MSGAWALAAHSLRRKRVILLGLGLVLAGFQFLLTQVGVYLMRTQAFGMLANLVPEFVRSLAGPSMVMFMSFAGVVSLGYFHPIVLAALLGLSIAIACEPAGEAETRFLDLTLARPIRRADLVTRTLIVLAAAAALLLTMMAAATSIGLACCTPATAPRPSGAVVRALVLNLGLIMWCWGGIALAIAAGAKRSATAAGVSGVAALIAYLVDYLGRVWDPARVVSRLSPFHYFEPMAAVSGGGIAGQNILTLFTIGLAATIVSYAIFLRRDL